MTDKKNTPSANRSIRHHLALASFAAAILVFGAGGWAATTELSGAVLANGRVVVDTNVKQVQHPLGGIVKTINVRNGQRVAAGEVLVSLDATVARANLAVINKALDALRIRQRRLEAERDGEPAFTLPEDIQHRLEEREFAELMQTETGFFLSRSKVRAGLRAQLEERVLQLQEQPTASASRPRPMPIRSPSSRRNCRVLRSSTKSSWSRYSA